MNKLLLVVLAVFMLLAGCSSGDSGSTPSSFSVAGKVASKSLDGTDVGWPDVTVTLDGDLNLTTTTDANGNYSFTVPEGEYRVSPTQRGITFDPPSSAWAITDANLGSVDFSVKPLTAGADTQANTWQMTGSMVYQRQNHTMTILNDGRVLVTGGGADSDLAPRATCEIYDPATGTWKLTGKMKYQRIYHTATLLEDGKVLVAGGSSGTSPRASAELYDPVTGTWTDTGSMLWSQKNHTAIRLANGKVMMAGYDSEIYDPKTGVWEYFGWGYDGMWRRRQHTATLVPHTSGIASSHPGTQQIILIGGNFDLDPGMTNYSMVDTPQWALDDSSYAWLDMDPMGYSRRNHTATLMPDGTILVVGGAQSALGTSVLSSVESFKKNMSNYYSDWSWHYIPPMTYDRSHHTATLLPNGQLLVAGGFSGADQRASAELYDSVAKKWVTTNYMKYARERHTAALLADGRVLVAGGKAGTWSSRASCELFNPAP